ncbi:hypothetical protein CRYUN_Cryun09bG0219100 [Craigia yunnanensis]
MDLSTMDLLLSKIFSILENEASLLSGVRDEINEIKLELNSMRSFLDDADKTAGLHSQAKNDWVANVRDIACEIEDVLNEFMYHMSRQQQWRGNKYTSFFLKGIHFPHNLFLRHKTADKLQKINKKLINMQNRNNRYGVNQLDGKDDEKMKRMLRNYDSNWLRNESESSLFLKDDDLVGIEKTQSKLLGWLINGVSTICAYDSLRQVELEPEDADQNFDESESESDNTLNEVEESSPKTFQQPESIATSRSKRYIQKPA